MASAQETAPIVVVIEGPRSVDADQLRAALRRGGLRVVALADDAAVTARELLSVRLTRDARRAHLQLRSPRGTSVHRLTAPRADASGRWLVGPMLALVASSRAPSAAAATPSDVLDPWAARPAPSGQVVSRVSSEVLDPWRGAPAPSIAVARTIASEVLDPWGASAPRRAGWESSGQSEVLDPWAERAEMLDAPRR